MTEGRRFYRKPEPVIAAKKITIATGLESHPEITVPVLTAVPDSKGYAWLVYEDELGVHTIRADAPNVKVAK